MRDQVVLVVEDEEHLRDLEQTLVQDLCGVRTVGAPDGEEALAFAAETPPSLILLDIMLPGIDGLEVARTLRQSPLTQHIPIIAVTASTAPDRAMAAGCDDFIAKPFDVDHFLSKVRRYLSPAVLATC